MASAQRIARVQTATGKTVMEVFAPKAEGDPLSVCLRMLTHQLQLRTPEDRHAGGCFGGAFGYGVRFENETFLMCPDYMDAECTCGQSEAAETWHAGHPHAVNCYDTLLYDGRLKTPELDQQMERALKTRAKYRWGSPAETLAQAEVTRLANLQDAHHRKILKALCRQFRIPWNKGAGSMVHCTCGHDTEAKRWFKAHPHDERCPVELPNFWHFRTGLKVRWYKYIGRDMEIIRRARPPVSLQKLVGECLASIDAPSLEDAFNAYVIAEDEAAAESKRAVELWMSEEGQKAMGSLIESGVVQVHTSR